MAWHGYILLSFSGTFGEGGVKEADRPKLEKGLDALVTDYGKTKERPQYDRQIRWSRGGDKCIVEAQFKAAPDKPAILSTLLPEVFVPLDGLLDFTIFGMGKDDWNVSRQLCLEYIDAHPKEWSRQVDEK